jgi:hypothetical protein
MVSFVIDGPDEMSAAHCDLSSLDPWCCEKVFETSDTVQVDLGHLSQDSYSSFQQLERATGVVQYLGWCLCSVDFWSSVSRAQHCAAWSPSSGRPSLRLRMSLRHVGDDYLPKCMVDPTVLY